MNNGIANRIVAILSIITISITLSSCGSTPQDDIVGKWKFPTFSFQSLLSEGHMEFFDDGRLQIRSSAGTVLGKYSFLEDSRIRIEYENPDKIQFNEVFKLRFVDKGDLQLLSENGLSFVLDREK